MCKWLCGNEANWWVQTYFIPWHYPTPSHPINYSEHAATDLNLPLEYIKIVPHPHSHDRTVQIIPLSTSSRLKEATAFEPTPSTSPWAPFENLADFEYTETAVKGLLSKELVNTQLAKINSTWAAKSMLSIKSYRDMEAVLSKARRYFVQVCNCIFWRHCHTTIYYLSWYINQISVQERNYHGHVWRPALSNYIWVSRSLEMDIGTHSRWVASPMEYVECCKKVLLPWR